MEMITSNVYNIDNKIISVPVNHSIFAIEGDTNSRIVTFKIARYFDGVDLSQKEIVVNYVNANNQKGYITTQNKIITNTTLSFDWKASSGATAYAGDIKIEIEFLERNEGGTKIYSLQTRPLTLNVSASLKGKNVAKELDYTLEKLFVEENSNHTYHTDVIDQNVPSVINVRKRTITINTDEIIAIQDDNHSQILSFRMDRYIDGIDVAEKVIAIKFENADGDSDLSVTCNHTYTDTEVWFGWLINNKVTIASGMVGFAVEVLGYLDDGSFYVWSTLPSLFKVEAGFRLTGEILQPYPSWFQSWLIESDNNLRQMAEYNNSTTQKYDEIILALENAETNMNNTLDEIQEMYETVQQVSANVENYTYFNVSRYNKRNGVFENVDYKDKDEKIFMSSILTWSVALEKFTLRTEVKYDVLGSITSMLDYAIEYDSDGDIIDNIPSMRQYEYHGLL